MDITKNTLKNRQQTECNAYSHYEINGDSRKSWCINNKGLVDQTY